MHAAILREDIYDTYHVACPVQSCLQFHSGQLLDLSRPPLASSMLGSQSLVQSPPSAAMQPACLQERLESLSWPGVGCS